MEGLLIAHILLDDEDPVEWLNGLDTVNLLDRWYE